MLISDMIDREIYSADLAGKICGYVHERSGGRGFGGGLFTKRKGGGNSFPIWNGYEMRIFDRGQSIEAVIARSNGQSALHLKEQLRDLSVEKKYRDVISSVYIEDRGEDLAVGVRFVPMENSAGRTQNDRKLFHAFLNAAVKPALSAAFGEK